ncbi:YiiX/YebB-like N1pC/P60 family cysteine hydrolase [Sphingobacterium sp. LRF_L2]|uniref:YiiX/YebB-like N1pC/P60 family cysteine hydrolase n=1 Tax=Sphingobacterium sp. LRF_L2 TaxID=3369421 RepID=UPI003F6379A4
MKKTIIILALFFQILSLQAQDSLSYQGITLYSGDLIFVGAQVDNLSGAINRVTQRSSAISFDHIGLIELADGKPCILHASTAKGSAREPLDSLIQRNKDKKQAYAIYRVNTDFQYAIPKALAQAKTMLGKPYNWSYILNDSSYYCSDYVQRAFQSAQLFNLEPMTFKNPETNSFDEFWISFYAKLQLDIPEGQPGCNPNGMAANPNIHYIGSFSTSN